MLAGRCLEFWLSSFLKEKCMKCGSIPKSGILNDHIMDTPRPKNKSTGEAFGHLGVPF